MKRGTITDAGNLELGSLGEEAGVWSLQVTGYAGLTSITPQVSNNGVDWVAASVKTPLAPSTVAATITANGVYYLDLPGLVRARLLGAGIGSAVVEALPSRG